MRFALSVAEMVLRAAMGVGQKIWRVSLSADADHIDAQTDETTYLDFAGQLVREVETGRTRDREECDPPPEPALLVETPRRARAVIDLSVLAEAEIVDHLAWLGAVQKVSRDNDLVDQIRTAIQEWRADRDQENPDIIEGEIVARTNTVWWVEMRLPEVAYSAHDDDDACRFGGVPRTKLLEELLRVVRRPRDLADRYDLLDDGDWYGSIVVRLPSAPSASFLVRHDTARKDRVAGSHAARWYSIVRLDT